MVTMELQLVQFIASGAAESTDFDLPWRDEKKDASTR
jgi:hypothetical protein